MGATLSDEARCCLTGTRRLKGAFGIGFADFALDPTCTRQVWGFARRTQKSVVKEVPMFVVLKKSLELAREVRGHIEDVARHDRNVADQMRRSIQSVVLNTAEARHARGKRAVDRFSLAYGELKELEAALEIAAL